MSRRPNVVLEQFACHVCGTALGWSSPGEARRMNSRAHVYCTTCKDAPAEPTERQRALITALQELAARGENVTISGASKEIGVSVSRAQQLATSIRARGGPAADELAAALERPSAQAAEPGPTPEVHLEVTPAPAPAPQVDAELLATAPPMVQPPSHLMPAGNVVNPTDDDPAAHGALME